MASTAPSPFGRLPTELIAYIFGYVVNEGPVKRPGQNEDCRRLFEVFMAPIQ